MADDIDLEVLEDGGDKIAARGIAMLRMAIAVERIRDKKAKEALLKGMERVMSSIPIAETKGSHVRVLKQQT